MPFPFRLAAIDLDETLLGPNHCISERNHRAVRMLADSGVTCVIASGRMHEATTRYANELGLAAPIISYNGSLVRVHGAEDVWLHSRVPAAPAAEVIHFCQAHGLHLNYYLDDRLYVSRKGKWAEFYVNQTGSPMEEIGSLDSLAGTEPTKMILIDAPETVNRLLADFRNHFDGTLYITTTNPEYLEFMNTGANKGRALELVASMLGVPREETIAFGDGHNDLPMIRWAGTGVAMGGAKQEILEAASLVAPPYDQDGLAVAIEQLFLVSKPDLAATTSRS